jgi:hypothetical protein
MQLTNRVRTVLAKSAVAAGATDITDAAVIDMQGYEGVRFIYSFGAITAGAVTSVAVASKATNAPTPGTDDLAGSSITVADDADDKIVIVDIYKPRLRYLRPFVKRATQNAVVNCIVAELYGRKGKMPVTQDATVSGQELWVSPANGVA